VEEPGALAGSTALEQWRKQGRWPVNYDRFWEQLRQRHGKQDGTRVMIEVLTLGQNHGWGELENAVTTALELGCFDVSAVRLLLENDRHWAPRTDYQVEIGTLSRYDRPQPMVNEYDRLLSVPGTEVMQ